MYHHTAPRCSTHHTAHHMPSHQLAHTAVSSSTSSSRLVEELRVVRTCSSHNPTPCHHLQVHRERTHSLTWTGRSLVGLLFTLHNIPVNTAVCRLPHATCFTPVSACSNTGTLCTLTSSSFCLLESMEN